MRLVMLIREDDLDVRDDETDRLGTESAESENPEMLVPL
jgi:hypothetical protein